MKDWIDCIKEHVDTDLWGFIALDYYHHKKAQKYEGSPSQFIDEVLCELPREGFDIVAFHNTLLSVCVQLLGIDFSDIISKSTEYLNSLKDTPTEKEIEAIAAQYKVYDKHEVFLERIAALPLGIAKTQARLEKGNVKEDLTLTRTVDSEADKRITRVPSPASAFLSNELPVGLAKQPFKHTHLLRYYSQPSDLSAKKPFKNKRVFLLLHFLKDLVPFVKAAGRLGLDMEKSYFFYKEYPYPQRDAIVQWLNKENAVVQPRSSIPDCLEKLAMVSPGDIGDLLIIEDGGFFVPLIHREFKNLIPHVIGAVEQTSRGIRNAEELAKEDELKFPIISVATSKLKNEFEPPYIARAIIDNIRQMLPDTTVTGKKVALFGCGTIGREIAQWLRANGADITVFEPDAENKLWGVGRGFTFVDSPMQAVQNKRFVIGASGNESITSEVVAELSHGTYLLSASSELYEIDVDELQQQAIENNPLYDDSGKYLGTDFTLPPNDRTVHLLANGYPINFWGFESMPQEASDLILSLIILSAAELAMGNYTLPRIDSEAVNRIAKKYKLAQKFLEFHKQG